MSRGEKRMTAFLFGTLALISCRTEETVVPADTVVTDTSAVSTAAGPPPATDTTTAAMPESRVAVRLVDYEIQMPGSIPAGNITFDVENGGKRKHSFEIEGYGIEAELEPVLAPGEKGSLTVELKPGRYKVYCPVGDHEKKHGMVTYVDIT